MTSGSLLRTTTPLRNLRTEDIDIDDDDRKPDAVASPINKSPMLTKKEKRDKSKQIKKILKKRLNIDCLRMLGEEEGANVIETKNLQDNKGDLTGLMMEIGVENHYGGLTTNFL